MTPPSWPSNGPRRLMGGLRSLASERGARWLLVSGAVGLLVFLVGPLVALAQERQPALYELPVFACIASFVALYLWAVPSDLAGRPGTRPVRTTVLLGVACVVIALAQPRIDWTVLFILAGTAAGRIARPRTAAMAIAVIAGCVSLILRAAGAAPIDALESGFEVVLAGLVVFGFSQLERTVRELRLAQAHAARLAVADERLRIARDMHDLLGHSLSVIALKAELAGRLVERAPRRAAVELRDIESVTRSSLRDVREAVAGYRRVSLDTELAGARAALTAAGLAVEIRPPPAGTLDEATDTLLGWIVREAVTNVVRHSDGVRCVVSVTRVEREIRLEVVDDGDPHDEPPHEERPHDEPPREERSPAAPERVGSGLAGIRERLEAIGGRMEAGPVDGSGFRLAAFVPVRGGQETSTGHGASADLPGERGAGGASADLPGQRGAGAPGTQP